VHHGHARVVAGLRRGRRGIGIALDEDRGRRAALEDRAEPLDHPADLGVPWLAADAVEGLRLRESGPSQEHAGKFLIAVLAAVQQPGAVSQHAHNWGKLNYFRARAHHSGNIWVIGRRRHKCSL
jgi:hypothetical protein